MNRPPVAKHARIAGEVVCTRGKASAKDFTANLSEVSCHWCTQALTKERAVWFLLAAEANETATALALASPCWSGPDDGGLEHAILMHVEALESALKDATTALTRVRSEVQRLVTKNTTP